MSGSQCVCSLAISIDSGWKIATSLRLSLGLKVGLKAIYKSGLRVAAGGVFSVGSSSSQHYQMYRYIFLV